MPASVATHGLLLLYVISSSTYNSDHEGPLKTCWGLLGSFRITEIINNSAYMPYIFRILFALICFLWVYLHESRLFGYLSLESDCLFFPLSQNHVFHAVVISAAKWRLWTVGTSKLLRNFCDLTETCLVCLFFNSLFVLREFVVGSWDCNWSVLGWCLD